MRARWKKRQRTVSETRMKYERSWKGKVSEKDREQFEIGE
jgi:hypothetical protein